MMPEECIDLVTPEADRQPRTRRSALPSHSHAATVTLSFDLTTATPLPVSARGIADDDNDRRSGDARHDSDRPPDIPRLRETRENTLSNTSSALAPVTAPVTNSSTSPQKKKSRSLLRRYSSKENLTPWWMFWREKTPLSHHQRLVWILTHNQRLAWILSESLSWRERTNLGGPGKFPAF